MAKKQKENPRENAREITAELREKIKSKMDGAKFFAGFITLLVGILLRYDGELCFPSQVGIVFLAASLGLCVAAFFCYDRLLMPRKYWKLSDEERAEVPFQDRLHAEMIHSWRWLFVPAVSCFGFGFLLVLADVLRLDFRICVQTEAKGTLLGILLTLAVVAPICLLLLTGPKFRD